MLLENTKSTKYIAHYLDGICEGGIIPLKRKKEYLILDKNIKIGDKIEIISTTSILRKGIISVVEKVQTYNGFTNVYCSGVWIRSGEYKIIQKI